MAVGLVNTLCQKDMEIGDKLKPQNTRVCLSFSVICSYHPFFWGISGYGSFSASLSELFCAFCRTEQLRLLEHWHDRSEHWSDQSLNLKWLKHCTLDLPKQS
jgi:hypothetical protein